MILVRNIRLPLSAGEPQAFEKALREARIPRAKVQHLGVAKLSVDARRGQPKLVYTVAVTLKNEAEEPAFAGASANVSLHSRTDFRVQRGTQKLPHRPVVCGLGPAGLFAALLLARQGYRLSSICEPQEDGGIAILYAAPGFLEECLSDQGLPVPDDIPAALAARGFCMAEGC